MKYFPRTLWLQRGQVQKKRHNTEKPNFRLSWLFNLMVENDPLFAMKVQRGNEGIAQLILNHATRWRSVVTPTPRPLYPVGKYPHYPTNWWLGGPHNWSGCIRHEETPEFKPSRYTKLFRLPYAYHSSFVSKILTSSTTHKEETPGRIHQTYCNFLRKKRKFLWNCYMYELYTATFNTLYVKVNTTFFIASKPVRKPCTHNIIFNFSRILVTAL